MSYGLRPVRVVGACSVCGREYWIMPRDPFTCGGCLQKAASVALSAELRRLAALRAPA